jgi:hypothetical protein
VRSPVIASDPISLVAAEIHLGYGPAVITGGWPAILYSNYVPAQQSPENRFRTIRYKYCIASNGYEFMPFEKAKVQKISFESECLIFGRRRLAGLAGASRNVK